MSGRGTHSTPSTEARSEKGALGPRLCDLCQGRVLERHCKIVCLNCGYQRDCSDP